MNLNAQTVIKAHVMTLQPMYFQWLRQWNCLTRNIKPGTNN